MDTRDKVALPVCPQPRAASVAVIVVDAWIVEQLCIPTLIQVYVGKHFSFVEFFTGRVLLSDIRLCVGELWPAGAPTYAGSDKAPLPEDGIVNLVPGLLIRVVSPSIIPGLTLTLAERLAEPEGWLHPPSHQSTPVEESGFGKVRVLGHRADQLVLKVTRTTTAGHLRQTIMKDSGLASEHTSFCTPTRQLWNFTSRGSSVKSVIGLIPAALRECRGIFVDGRCLACKV